MHVRVARQPAGCERPPVEWGYDLDAANSCQAIFENRDTQSQPLAPAVHPEDPKCVRAVTVRARAQWCALIFIVVTGVALPSRT